MEDIFLLTDNEWYNIQEVGDEFLIRIKRVNIMNLENMIKQVKSHPDYPEAGMILCHNGVVRKASREGQEVTGLSVQVDHEKLKEIVETQKKKKGIIEVLVDINENKTLGVGDDVMFIVVAGDIRENVIETLSETLNRVKSEATSKEQFFV